MKTRRPSSAAIRSRRGWTLLETLSIVTLSATLSAIAFPLYADMPVGYRPYHVPTQAELNTLEQRREIMYKVTCRNLDWMRAHPGEPLPMSLRPSPSHRIEIERTMMALAEQNEHSQMTFTHSDQRS